MFSCYVMYLRDVCVIEVQLIIDINLFCLTFFKLSFQLNFYSSTKFFFRADKFIVILSLTLISRFATATVLAHISQTQALTRGKTKIHACTLTYHLDY